MLFFCTRADVFYKIVFLKNFAKFTGKQPRQRLFLIKKILRKFLRIAFFTEHHRCLLFDQKGNIDIKRIKQGIHNALFTQHITDLDFSWSISTIMSRNHDFIIVSTCQLIYTECSEKLTFLNSWNAHVSFSECFACLLNDWSFAIFIINTHYIKTQMKLFVCSTISILRY